MKKDFGGWCNLKEKLDSQSTPPLFEEREIWWCNVGMNVGYEVFGKGNLFIRPVLVLRKFSQNSFYGVPLTKTTKESPYHLAFEFQGHQSVALLTQVRAFDSRRLHNPMGKLSESKVEEVRKAVVNTL